MEREVDIKTERDLVTSRDTATPISLTKIQSSGPTPSMVTVSEDCSRTNLTASRLLLVAIVMGTFQSMEPNSGMGQHRKRKWVNKMSMRHT